MPDETHHPNPDPPALTRREAMLQVLRVGAVAAGAGAAAVWLSDHRMRPEASRAEKARHDHRTASNAQFPRLTVVQGGEPRALVQRALADLGGIQRFVSRQDVVVSSPTSPGTAPPNKPPTPTPKSSPKSFASANRPAPSASSSPTSAATSRAAVSSAPASRLPPSPKAPKSSSPIPSSIAKSTSTESC